LETSDVVSKPPDQYFKTGYRPSPGGVSSFMFLTRASDKSRVQKAFLSFDNEDDRSIRVRSKFGTEYQSEKSALTQSLRTGVGINTLDIAQHLDYVAFRPYKQLDNVIDASNFTKPARFIWKDYWSSASKELEDCSTSIVTLRRVNPYSPSISLLSFWSTVSLSPSDLLNVIEEKETETAKALCVLINSIIFLSQFFLLKDETTGRYIDIRLYDYYQMIILPNKDKIGNLCTIFDDYAQSQFPSLRAQLDTAFDARYNIFWLEKGQKTLFEMNQVVTPSSIRLEFDMAICRALGLDISEQRLRQIYTVLVNEMIMTKGLRRDARSLT
jgi:hypothetical protein